MTKLYEDLMIEGFDEDVTDKLFVRTLVHSLPPDKVAIIALKLTDSFTTEEMSEILGISTGTVWSRYKSALKTLKRNVGNSL